MDLLCALPGDIPGQSSWWKRDVESLRGASALPLSGHAQADVTIVGGGFTGLWTALTLRQRDPALKVVLLEASRLGDGASSRNGGIVHGYWAALPANIRSIGVEAALEIAKLGSKAQAEFKKFVTSPGYDVWWEEAGNLRVATCPAQEKAITKYLAQIKGLGVDSYIQPKTKSEVREILNSSAFESGIYFPEAGNVHPGRLVLALKSAAIAAGVTIYEQSPVSRVVEGEVHRVETKHGSVLSRHVVLATNVGLAGVRAIGLRLSLFSSYATMSNSAEDALHELGWRSPVGINDARMFLHYSRKTRDNRVLMGSGSGPIGFGTRIENIALRTDAGSSARAKAGMARIFPQVAIQGFANTWGWPIDVSSDRIPFFKTLRAGIHYGAGFSGHGVQATWIAGQCLSSLVMGVTDEWTSSPFCRRPVPLLPPEPMKFVGSNVIRNAILTCEELEEQRIKPPLFPRVVSALPGLLGLRIGVR